MHPFVTFLGAFSIFFLLAACQDSKPPPSPEPSEKVCGTLQGLTCPDEQYCELEIGQCQMADAQGICRTKPMFCTEEFNPVCGCDGQTYGNACEAASAGVSIDHKGECKSSVPQACGGIAGITCPEGQSCTDDPSDDCDPAQGGADCPGICMAD